MDPHAAPEMMRLTPEPHAAVTIIKENVVPPPQTASKKAARISFEDYHSTWSGIATSKSTIEAKNPCKKFLCFHC